MSGVSDADGEDGEDGREVSSESGESVHRSELERAGGESAQQGAHASRHLGTK